MLPYLFLLAAVLCGLNWRTYSYSKAKWNALARSQDIGVSILEIGIRHVRNMVGITNLDVPCSTEINRCGTGIILESYEFYVSSFGDQVLQIFW